MMMQDAMQDHVQDAVMDAVAYAFALDLAHSHVYARLDAQRTTPSYLLGCSNCRH